MGKKQKFHIYLWKLKTPKKKKCPSIYFYSLMLNAPDSKEAANTNFIVFGTNPQARALKASTVQSETYHDKSLW